MTEKNQLPAGDLAREHNWHGISVCDLFTFLGSSYVKSNMSFLAVYGLSSGFLSTKNMIMFIINT